MRNFLKNHVFNSIGVKLLSLLFGIVLWFIFTNVEDPLVVASFEVPVQIENIEEYQSKNRYIEIDGSRDISNLNLTVYLRGRSSEIESLKNRNVSSFLNVYVDLYEITPEESDRLSIHYELVDPSVKSELYSYRNKSYYSVDVEDYITKEVPIRYTITGEPADGYLYLENDKDIQLSSKVVTLTGPEDQVSEIAYGYTSVDVTAAASNISVSGEVILKDAEGNSISYSRDVIRTSVNDISIYIPIYNRKTVRLKASVENTVPAGYEYKGDIAIDNDKIEIYGQESVLNKLSVINLPAVDLSTVTGEYSKPVYLQSLLNEIYGDNVVRLMGSSPVKVIVSLTVEEQIERTETIDTDKIRVLGVPETFEYSFANDEVELTFYGLEENFENFDENNTVMYTVKFAEKDLTDGEHTMNLEVTGTGKVFVKPQTVKINLKTKPAESSPDTDSEN